MLPELSHLNLTEFQADIAEQIAESDEFEHWVVPPPSPIQREPGVFNLLYYSKDGKLHLKHLGTMMELFEVES